MLASLRCAADSLIRKLTIERSSGYCSELSKIVYLHVSGLIGERLFLSKVAGKVTGGSRYDSVSWTNPVPVFVSRVWTSNAARLHLRQVYLALPLSAARAAGEPIGRNTFELVTYRPLFLSAPALLQLF